VTRFGGPANPLERVADTRVFETYPVLAVMALGWTRPDARAAGHLPKYNPGRKKTFSRAVKNTGRVFEKAAKKLGEKIYDPGVVPPKGLKGVLENAPFCDDELGAEYFGGVLASSRSGVERDDRGAALLSLVGRLASEPTTRELSRTLKLLHCITTG
jgi:hypothetical protein